MSEREELGTAVKGDRKQQLEGIRDYITHQLEGNLCNTCLNSRLRTGDQASLILRLQDVLKELDALKPSEEGNRLDNIRRLRPVVGGEDVPSDDPLSKRKSGTRKPGAGRPPKE